MYTFGFWEDCALEVGLSLCPTLVLCAPTATVRAIIWQELILCSKVILPKAKQSQVFRAPGAEYDCCSLSWPLMSETTFAISDISFRAEDERLSNRQLKFLTPGRILVGQVSEVRCRTMCCCEREWICRPIHTPNNSFNIDMNSVSWKSGRKYACSRRRKMPSWS